MSDASRSNADKNESKNRSNPKIDLPLDSGHDLEGADEGAGALNQRDKDLEKGRWMSGSSNRQEGYDLHPHRGDHGEAQKRGSASEADYDGETVSSSDDILSPIEDEDEL